jgi:hypothetical protein
MKTFISILLFSLVLVEVSSQSVILIDFPKILTVFCNEFERLEIETEADWKINDYIHIGNFSKCMDPDDRFLINTKEFVYSVCAIKEIFFYDYSNWILIYDCNISDSIAKFSFDLIIDDFIIRRGNIYFKKTNSGWEKVNLVIDDINCRFRWFDKRFH